MVRNASDSSARASVDSAAASSSGVKKCDALASRTARGSDSSKKRRLNRRTTEEQAERAISTHMGAQNSLVKELVKIDGMSLKERIMKDKREAKDSGKKLGSSYWQNVKEMYSVHDLECTLVVRDSSQVVNSKLIEALKQATSPNTTVRSKSLLQSYFQQAKDLNQKECVGCVKHLLRQKVQGNPINCKLMLHFMKCIVRLGKSSAFKEEVELLKDQFDLVLLWSWGEWSQEGLDLTAWHGCYKPVLPLVMDESSMDALVKLPDDSSWSSVKLQLQKITSGSMVGAKIFGKAMDLVNSESIQASIEEAIKTLPADHISQAHIDQITAKVNDLTVELGLKTLTTRRIIDITYRTLQLQVPVTNVMEELTIRVAAHVKSVMGSELTRLEFEKPLPELAQTTRVDDAVYKEWQLARQACNKVLKEYHLSDTRELAELLHRKGNMFLAIDPTFVIELGAMDSLMAEGGLKLMKDSLLKCLPSAKDLFDPEASVQKLQVLKDSELHRFSGDPAKSLFKAILELVEGIKVGTSPAVEFMNSDSYLRDVKEVLPFFVQKVAKPGSAPLTGKAALKFMMDEVTKMKEEDLTLEHLHPLQTFSWLLAPPEQEALKSLTKAVVKQRGGSKRPGGGEKGQASKKTKKKEAEAEKDEVLALFE